MGVLNLPPVPPELKSISPYLQRADELTSRDPVMAYWCTYYAAQIGIARKAKDPAARTFLFALLGALENMKKDVGANDAIDDESASSAYVENFALKVFAMADNEDRRGEATRGTAKKFLAAANFLELLRVFDKDKSEPPAESSTEEKIRYAKWKAADIAKAFREGPLRAHSATSVDPASARGDAHRPPPPLTNLPSPQEHGFSLASTPPHAGSFLAAQTSPHSPGNWSTVATPGTPGVFAVGDEGGAVQSPGREPQHAHVSDELEGGRWIALQSAMRPRPPLPLPSLAGEFDPFTVNVIVDSPPASYGKHTLPSVPATVLPPPPVPSAFSPDPHAPPLWGTPSGFVPSLSPPRGPSGLPPAPPRPVPHTFAVPQAAPIEITPRSSRARRGTAASRSPHWTMRMPSRRERSYTPHSRCWAKYALYESDVLLKY
ncbi:Vacuolar protein sorting-associated protein VTA1 [Grifola frondosa]|uniref:Vacuolar protein sorting-associated protein VTA1 n=1 Tax=Grifola frondosa TaxID=5627 RepID=A0A1C7MQL4_GRIFR|nr:Vacuolar protein sorting-associated protein VTA1 [Grifola frondosa]